MSIAAMIVRFAGLDWFRPSCMICVMWVRREDVECCALKPCCEGANGMSGVMSCRTSLSSILEGLLSSEIGLYEVRSVGGLCGLSRGVILASFHMLGMQLFVMEWLNICVRALMACEPKCFRCKYEMPSGPVEVVFFVLRMAAETIVGVNGGVPRLGVWSLCSARRICLSCVRGGRRLVCE